jgi:alpha-N-arabinofuranosidase
MDRRAFLGTASGLAATSAAWKAAWGASLQAAPTVRATVTIDPGREIGRMDPKLYGHFLEHVERVVYGGVFDPGSRFADDLGLRKDVVAAIREMGGARVLRWPGGNFASYYRWKDGIGPREKRPRRYDVAWRNYESNRFGTDEYLALCRHLGCEPFITVNMGNGTLEEACEWVEYCRLSDRQPPVRIWGLGNELYGRWQVGHCTAAEYAHKAEQFGQFMRSVEPDLKLVGVGSRSPEWNDGVLKGCGAMLDWLTIHLYGHRTFLDGDDDFDSIVATPALFEREIKEMIDQIAALEPAMRRREPLKVCLEEWNDRHMKKGAGTTRNPGLIRESPRNIVDALFVAGVFNCCQRLSERVTMTNYVFVVNAHGPIFAYPDGLVKSAVFDVFRLYATRLQPVAVQANVQCEKFSALISWEGRQQQVAAERLDVSATRSVDGRKLSVALLNRYKTSTMRVALELSGRAPAAGVALHSLYAPDINAVNSLQEPNKVRSVSRALNGALQYVDLPPHSVNLLELTLT